MYCTLHLTKRVVLSDKCPPKSPCVLTPDDEFYIDKVLYPPKYNAEHKGATYHFYRLMKAGVVGCDEVTEGSEPLNYAKTAPCSTQEADGNCPRVYMVTLISTYYQGYY